MKVKIAILEERSMQADKALGLAFDAQKEAAKKQLEAQHEYNVTHNDLMRRMDKQAEEMINRREYNINHEILRNLIGDMKATLDKAEGAIAARMISSANVKWVIGLLLALLGVLGYHVMFVK